MESNLVVVGGGGEGGRGVGGEGRGGRGVGGEGEEKEEDNEWRIFLMYGL